MTGIPRTWSKVRLVEAAFLVLCVLAAFRPMMSNGGSEVGNAAVSDFPGWAALPGLAHFTPLSLSPRDARFAEQFPGKISAFGDGQYIWIARWVAQPTRKLHPAADCLRAVGYSVHPEPIFADNSGAHWGVISASHGSGKLTVRERIIDRAGREFTDVSAWYWAAVLEKSTGPWWCLTRIDTPAVSH